MASTRRRVRADGTVTYNVRFRYADGTATSRTTKARHRDAFLGRLAQLHATGVPVLPGTLDPPESEPPVTVAAWLDEWVNVHLVERARPAGSHLAPSRATSSTCGCGCGRCSAAVCSTG